MMMKAYNHAVEKLKEFDPLINDSKDAIAEMVEPARELAIELFDFLGAEKFTIELKGVVITWQLKKE